MKHSNIFITGASRSGTSMTAGLLAKHGVWFGPCNGPNRINKKGFYESRYIKSRIKKQDFNQFSEGWDEWRKNNNATEPWGVKTGVEHYHLFKPYNPIVVCCYRDMDDTLLSRKNAQFLSQESIVKRAWEQMDAIPNAIKVHPSKFIKGDYTDIIPVLRLLDLEFNIDIADEWVDPSLWKSWESK